MIFIHWYTITKLPDILCRKERSKYQHHREKARSSPDKYMTIIIDGMDQAKTNLPQTSLLAKSLSTLWKLRTHVTGVLLHTKCQYGKIAYTFVDLLQFPHDSNLTITVLLKVLQSYADLYQKLPETLYLQMDNTCRENKNKYILAFCAMLVEMKIFKKVCSILVLILFSYCTQVSH